MLTMPSSRGIAQGCKHPETIPSLLPPEAFSHADRTTPLTFRQLRYDEVFEFLHRWSDGTGLGPWRKTGPATYTRASGPYKPGGIVITFRVDTADVKVIRQELPRQR